MQEKMTGSTSRSTYVTLLGYPLFSLSGSKIISFDNLAELARANEAKPIDIHAAGEEPTELTGEQLLLFCQAAGGVVAYHTDPLSGIIDELSASIPTHFEYDSHEIGEVLESLQASGPPPAKIVGDLAQTSVGIPGSTEVQVIGLSEWTLSWKRKTADATTTDNSSYESSLPSTASWSVKAKYMFIDGDPSQATNILAAISSQVTPPTWNFFPTIAQGRSAFSGTAYVDGIDIASGMGKCVGLDTSLKGSGPLYVISQIAPLANPNTVTGEQAEV